MITDKSEIEKIINGALQEAYDQGWIRSMKPENVFGGLYYPFQMNNIVGVYTSKKDVGEGVWFQLEDGSVWNKHGDYEIARPLENEYT